MSEPTIELTQEDVFAVIESLDRFLVTIRDAVRGIIAAERREHLTVVADDEGGDAS